MAPGDRTHPLRIESDRLGTLRMGVSPAEMSGMQPHPEPQPVHR
jgi:hypothetical protein